MENYFVKFNLIPFPFDNFLFQILLRIWDIFFYEGSVTLFRITLGMLKMKVNVMIVTIVHNF